ncbi:hypothetical protein L228DRAFT_249526 [Xylona heveae TC161]|uniref:RING-type domain-containing protein n=1 Tax=Xylona heveae (strain CBS 132557 / TC161) TaxID=1328760 RepID=A0A165F942_XYLHT|nr:hypothetical protein L228DRAFT_249526 [Xylona heveae TC161]KZF20722.1 hypothetical protein L228DRAFT_249526 [Xylona heveae TC161]
MSNQSPALSSSKISNTPPQISIPAQSHVGPPGGAENYSQRRGGGSSSFGGGSAFKGNSPSARSNQSQRKQHKSSKKPRLATEDAIAEAVAMRSTNSRKGQTSITHLMNFSLPPRPPSHYSHAHGRPVRRNPTWGLGSGYHAVDKARYVHANYRFIVKPNGDYRAQAVDADIHLDWSSVLQVLASALSQSAACPICLSEPVAPRMARCGHIFCLPCLLRYMHSTDGTKPVPEKKSRSQKCPICYDTVYMAETRPVRWFIGQEGEPPHEGADVVLRLVMRQPGSTLALPRDGGDVLEDKGDIPWHFAAEVADYARVMKGGESYMLSQYDEEIEALRRQEHEDELMFGEGGEWTRKAVNAINAAKEVIRGIGDPPEMPDHPVEKKSKRLPIDLLTDESEVPEMYLIDHARRSGQSSSAESSTPTSTIPEPSEAPHGPPPVLNHSGSREAPDQEQAAAAAPTHPPHKHGEHGHHPDSPYYFYQALLHYYLSPLDIRILKAAFGTFSAFPSALLPRVERVSTGHTIDDELRKRTKYLAHLPYGCEIGFLECDWTDIVPPEILDKFKPDLDRRRKRNQDKQVKEERDRLRAEKQEDKRWAAAGHRPFSLPRESFSEEDFQPLTAGDFAPSSADIVSTSSSPPWPSSRSHQGSAFASLASPSTSPTTPRTVWGTTAIAPASPTLHPRDSELHDDGWLQGWEKDLLHEDELIAQVEAASLGEEAKGGGNANKKKKKGKKITLMSTNARRGA